MSSIREQDGGWLRMMAAEAAFLMKCAEGSDRDVLLLRYMELAYIKGEIAGGEVTMALVNERFGAVRR